MNLPNVDRACRLAGTERRAKFPLSDVEKLSGLAYSTLARWCAEGRIPHERYGKKGIRVAADDVEKLLADARREGSTNTAPASA